MSVAASMRRAIGLRANSRATRLEQLQVVTPDLRAADPGFVIELMDGTIRLNAGAVKIGATGAFASPIANDTLRRELYSFAWLRHLDAARTTAAEQQTRGLLLAWARSPARHSVAAREPAVAARRAMALLAHADTALSGANAGDFDRIMDLVGEEFAAIAEATPRMPMALSRLTALIALAAFHVCRGASSAAERITVERRLTAELERQILPDGGHLSRNPAAALDATLDLLPLRRIYLTAKLPVPDAVTSALTRLHAMLMLLQHGDRQIGRFNGMGATSVVELSTVLKNLDWVTATDGQASRFAADTGYIRLAVGDAVVLFDSGPGHETLAGEAPFAGALSFEFSSGRSTVFTNCGSDHQSLALPRIEARATANHSALILGNSSSAPLTGARGGSTKAALEIYPGEDAPSAIVASTDGYRARFNTVHQRTLALLHDGWLLKGIERLETTGAADVPFEIRFHLHPSVYVEADADKRTLRLTASDGSRWAFTATGAEPALESSTFFAGLSGAKPTLQVVLQGRIGPAPPGTPAAATDVTWQLQRMSPGVVS